MSLAEFGTAIVGILGVAFLILLAILCIFGIWVVVASIHRWMHKNFPSYKNFWDSL